VNKKWLVIALFVSAAGCRQGIGERCQVNDDCSSGVCSTSSPRVCVLDDSMVGGIDADRPIDAMIDATPVAPEQPGR
jgi:hypothetical protein